MICVGVDNIIGTSYVVCGVIDPHDVVLVHALLFEENFVEFCCKINPGRTSRGGIHVCLCDLDTGQQMLLQFYPKILFKLESQPLIDLVGWKKLTVTAGSSRCDCEKEPKRTGKFSETPM